MYITRNIDLRMYRGVDENGKTIHISVFHEFIVVITFQSNGWMRKNSFPGVLCGYAPTPMDAWLFAQINNGNAISLPLGEEYTWTGRETMERTIEKLFSEPFGQGYPKSEAERKRKDTEILKNLRRSSQVDLTEFLKRLDRQTVQRILIKRDVIDYILVNGHCQPVMKWINKYSETL